MKWLVWTLALVFCVCSLAQANPTKIAVIGDFGTGDKNEDRVSEAINQWRPDYIITVGDNNYPSGSASTMDQNIGKYYQKFIGNYKGEFGPGSSDKNRFFPALGNHDSKSYSSHADYFSLPGNERYYDFIIAGTHFFVLNSNSTEPDGNTWDSVQSRWFQKAAQQSQEKFKVVVFHHPPFSSGTIRRPRAAMKWPFEMYNVNLVMSGHNHFYERLMKNGIPYIINGSGGADLYPITSVSPDSAVAYNTDFGYQQMILESDQITLRFVTHKNDVIDELIIRK